MTIGIITEPKSYTRKNFLKRLLNMHRTEQLSAGVNPFDLEVYILPFSIKTLDKMSPSRLKKNLGKIVRLFQKKGISGYILSHRLFCLCIEKGLDTSAFANGKGKPIFLKFMPLCARWTAKKTGIDLFCANVCIMDTKMDRISEYLMRELCFDTKRLYLCTKNLKSAKHLCESFCDETGLWIELCSTLDFHCDIVLNIDSCQVKLGNDLFIRNAKFGFDFCGYDICHTDAAALLPSLKLTPTEWIFEYYEK